MHTSHSINIIISDIILQACMFQSSTRRTQDGKIKSSRVRLLHKGPFIRAYHI
jgi:hypothetical protein